jgi:hypothetical protein
VLAFNSVTASAISSIRRQRGVVTRGSDHFAPGRRAPCPAADAEWFRDGRRRRRLSGRTGRVSVSPVSGSGKTMSMLRCSVSPAGRRVVRGTRSSADESPPVEWTRPARISGRDIRIISDPMTSASDALQSDGN